MEKKKSISISDRINSIEDMLSKTDIDLIVDFRNMNEQDTEYTKTEDIRELMPKKYLVFGDAIKQIGGKLLYFKSGSTGHTFKGVHEPGKLNKKSYAVKVVIGKTICGVCLFITKNDNNRIISSSAFSGLFILYISP